MIGVLWQGRVCCRRGSLNRWKHGRRRLRLNFERRVDAFLSFVRVQGAGFFGLVALCGINWFAVLSALELHSAVASTVSLRAARAERAAVASAAVASAAHTAAAADTLAAAAAIDTAATARIAAPADRRLQNAELLRNR